MTDDIQFLDSRARIHISGARTGGAVALIEVLAPAGSQPPLHVHHHEDEGFYVLQGELTLWVGDETHLLRAGDFLLAPKRVPHTVRAGEGGGRWLVTSTPARFEDFVRALGTPAGASEPPPAPDPEHVARVAAEHGIEILGPPGMLPADLRARAA